MTGDTAVDAEEMDEPTAEEAEPADLPPERDALDWVADEAVVAAWLEPDVVSVTGVVPACDEVSCEVSAPEMAELEAPEPEAAGLAVRAWEVPAREVPTLVETVEVAELAVLVTVEVTGVVACETVDVTGAVACETVDVTGAAA